MKHHPSTSSLRAKRSGAKQSHPPRSSRLLRRAAPRNDRTLGSLRAFLSRSETETERIAARFARTFRGGDVLLLSGELGAGKTVFVRGLAKGLGIRGRITSPTFVMMRIHEAHSRKPIVDSQRSQRRPRSAIGYRLSAGSGYRLSAIGYFVHVDAYRVRDPREFETIGLPEWVGRPDTVVVIEWGERVRSLFRRIPHYAISIRARSGDMRTVIITPPRRTLPLQ